MTRPPSIERLVTTFRADQAGRAAVGLVLEGVLVGLMTRPGTPAPACAFDVRLGSVDGDLLAGAGLDRSPQAVQRTVITDRQGAHPVVDRHETLTLSVSELAPGAEVHVHLFVAIDEFAEGSSH